MPSRLKWSAFVFLIAASFPPALHAEPQAPTSAEHRAIMAVAVQQELMVAALSCGAIERYNRFVLAFRPELQQADAKLERFFLRQAGEHREAAFHAFKTRLANSASLDSLHDHEGYCRASNVLLDQAAQAPSLQALLAAMGADASGENRWMAGNTP